MTDEHLPSPSSSDPSGGPSTDGMSEAELDAILADAASLSSEIAADVGEPDSAADKAVPQSATEPPAKPADRAAGNLDAQLSEMAELLDATADELGSDLPVFAEGGDEPGVVDPGSAGVDGTSDNAVGQTSSLSSDRLEAGPTGGPPGDQPEETTDPAGDKRERQSSPDDCPSDQRPEPTGSVTGRLSATGRLSPMAFAACEKGAKLLEVMDKPVAKVPEGARHVIGWIALATFGTALFVLLMSFL